jgi:L-glutamine-phosphate cytidylyltransferase
MKIIILAAGRGERLMPLTRNTPKPLLDMGNGSTLLEEQIQRLRESGVIDEIVLVIGYLADQVEAKMKLYRTMGVKIRTVFNPFYQVSNNLMSLWLAKHVLAEGDAMITNGDNIFAADVFRALAAESGDGITLSVCRKTDFTYDDMKVTLANDHIVRVSKDTDPRDAQAESPGLALVRGERARLVFHDHLEALARDDENLGKFWLEAFNHLYRQGVAVKPWFFDATNRWQEVDFHPDVTKAKSLLAHSVPRLAAAS